MLRENKLAARVNDCTIKYKPFVNLYQELCKLDTPYIWVRQYDYKWRGSRTYKDVLYYIDDIEIHEGEVMYSYDSSGWELPDSCKDELILKLQYTLNGEICDVSEHIKIDRFNRFNRFNYKSIDELLDNYDLRVPTEQELLDAEFVDGIPVLT